jgi:hypothetical protein
MPHGNFRRFGGWQAQWLIPAIQLSCSENLGPLPHMLVGAVRDRSQERVFVRRNRYAYVYAYGLVDIDTPWFEELVPEGKRKAFMKGHKDEFFS